MLLQCWLEKGGAYHSFLVESLEWQLLPLTALQLMVHVCATLFIGLCKKIVSSPFFACSKISRHEKLAELVSNNSLHQIF
jgi:hypothetical protein